MSFRKMRAPATAASVTAALKRLCGFVVPGDSFHGFQLMARSGCDVVIRQRSDGELSKKVQGWGVRLQFRGYGRGCRALREAGVADDTGCVVVSGRRVNRQQQDQRESFQPRGMHGGIICAA